jgi:glutaminase
VIPEFAKFKKEVKDIFNNVKSNTNGKVADYIPELANANPEDWGVYICTIDG